MNIIIVGCGKVGLTITERLANENHNITVIDTESEVVNQVSNTCDVMGFVGNGASYNMQMEAGIEEAHLLIAVTNSDEINILCCLIAKKAGNCRTIARIRNPIYKSELSYIKEELGLSMAVNPELTAATEISRLLRFPASIKVNTFANGRVELLEFQIAADSKLVGCSMIEIGKRFNSKILICVVKRGEETIIPQGNFILQAGDVISMAAPPAEAKAFFERIHFQINSVRSVMIIGGGKISYYLAMQLLAMGVAVKIIDVNRSVCERLSEELPKATIINGDASNQSVLYEEGIEHTEAFISLTNIDEENIMLSLFAKSVSAAKVVTKVNKIAFEDIVSNFDLGEVIHPKELTANYIADYVEAMENSMNVEVETLYKIVDNKAEALEFWVKTEKSFVDVPLKDLKLKDNLLIACINRNGKIITPNGDSRIQVGDTIIVITRHNDVYSIDDILEA